MPLRRTLLGAALSLILVGEPTVGASSGLYTPAGIIIFGALYVTFFWLIDALVARYKLTNGQLVAVTFGLYSVLITGLLHGELQDYIHHPQNDLITTLIRLQCSFFPLFVFVLLRRLAPVKPAVSLRTAVLTFVGFVLVISPSHSFGVFNAWQTVRLAPVPTLIYAGLAIVALIVSFGTDRHNAARVMMTSRQLTAWAWTLVVIGLVPLLAAFLLLVGLMPIVAITYLCHERFRRAPAAAL